VGEVRTADRLDRPERDIGEIKTTVARLELAGLIIGIPRLRWRWDFTLYWVVRGFSHKQR
jgi:hypothetical protein